MNIAKHLVVALVLVSLTACGGGGGSSSNPANDSVSSSPASNDSSVTPGTPSSITDTSNTGESSENASEGEIQTGSNETPITVDTPDTNSTGSLLAVSWNIPDSREDGSYLPVYEISGYEIRYSKNQGTDVTVVHIADPQTTDWVLENAEPGQYAFSIATIDSEGVYSDFSGETITTVQ